MSHYLSTLIELNSIPEYLWEENKGYGVFVPGFYQMKNNGFGYMQIPIGNCTDLVYWYHDILYIDFDVIVYPRHGVGFRTPHYEVELPWGHFHIVSRAFIDEFKRLSPLHDGRLSG